MRLIPFYRTFISDKHVSAFEYKGCFTGPKYELAGIVYTNKCLHRYEQHLFF